MLTVYKYPVHLTDTFTLQLPKHYEVLDVQMQGNAPNMWVLVDTEEPLEPVTFRLAGTGHPLDPDPEINHWHVGTFQMHGGALVFHLFEVYDWRLKDEGIAGGSLDATLRSEGDHDERGDQS